MEKEIPLPVRHCHGLVTCVSTALGDRRTGPHAKQSSYCLLCLLLACSSRAFRVVVLWNVPKQVLHLIDWAFAFYENISLLVVTGIVAVEKCNERVEQATGRHN